MGLTYRGTDVQTANIFLDLYSGFFEPPLVRGEDDVIPGRPGRDVMAREKDIRRLRLEGWVTGTGATQAARSQSWYAATEALMALLDYTLAPGALVVSSPYLGLPAGSKSIDVRAVGMVGGPVLSCMSAQRWSIDLECVSNPPDWS